MLGVKEKMLCTFAENTHGFAFLCIKLVKVIFSQFFLGISHRQRILFISLQMKSIVKKLSTDGAGVAALLILDKNDYLERDWLTQR